MFRFLFLIFIFCAVKFSAIAEVSNIYVSNNPYGIIKITKKNNIYSIDLSQLDESGGCQINATTSSFGKIIVLKTYQNEKDCYFDLIQKNGVVVFKQVDVDVCRNSNYFCGAHSGFIDNTFYIPKPEFCSPDKTEKTRKNF